MQAIIVPFWVQCMFVYMCRVDLNFHIGVGSNVVCSTEIGNARALVRGMDNRRFHAFLCPDIFDNALAHKGHVHKR